MNTRRLYRSRYDRQIAGVAAGMAEYLDLDPTLVRILWILSALFGGFTILLYVIFAFVIPEAPFVAAPGGPGAADAAGSAGGPAAPGGVAADGTETPGEPGPIEGWTSNPGWAAYPAGQPTRRRGAGAAFYAGILLIVFGALAMADSVIPGWAASVHLGPALLVALGAVLLVRATRNASEAR